MFAIALIQHLHDLAGLAPLVLYIGPDVFLPLTSALAAIAGVLLMFWHRVVGIVGRIFGRSSKRGSGEPPPGPTGD
jgi:hypothetical protein